MVKLGAISRWMHKEINVEEINPSHHYEEFWVENRKVCYVTKPTCVYEGAAQCRRLEMVTAPHFHPSLLGPLFDVIFLVLFNCADRIAHKCAHTNSPGWDKQQKGWVRTKTFLFIASPTCLTARERSGTPSKTVWECVFTSSLIPLEVIL